MRISCPLIGQNSFAPGAHPLPSYVTPFNINIRQFCQWSVSDSQHTQWERHLSLPKSREPPVVPYYLVEGKPHGPNHVIDNGWETGVHVIHGTMLLVGV